MFPIKFPAGFPECCRAFNDGAFSCVLDNFGGVSELGLLTGPCIDNVCCYDPFIRLLISRSQGKSLNRPLFGAGIRLLAKEASGRMSPIFPESPEIYPWGVKGGGAEQSYQMFLHDATLLFKVSRKKAKKICMVFAREHFFQGEGMALPNIWNDEFNRPYYEKLGIPISQEPFANGKYSVKWGEAEFSSAGNCLIFPMVLKQPYGDEKLFFAVGCSRPLSFRQFGEFYELSAEPLSPGSLRFAASVASDRRQALDKVQNGVLNQAAIIRNKIALAQRQIKNAPELFIDKLPEAQAFAQNVTVYQNAMLLSKNCGVRAAAHKYGYYAMWDTIYPIRDFLWQNQYQEAESIFSFLCDFPHIEVSPFAVSQIILTFDEISAYVRNESWEKTLYLKLKKMYLMISRLTDAETGLIFSLNACGVDAPAEIGLKGFFHAVCINSWYAAGSRTMENLAIRHKDLELEVFAAEKRRKLTENFLPVFFDEKSGFVHAAVNANGQHPELNIFHNSGTIGMDYSFGQYLFRQVYSSLSRYFMERLFHPCGHSAVAYDGEVPCEMWRFLHMNQHLSQECKLFRLSDKVEEARRTMFEYLKNFQKYAVAQETFNFNGGPGNETQTSNWQTFSAASAMEALRFGVCGIDRHAGGIYYIPAEDTGKIMVKNLKFFGRTLNFSISGRGGFAEIFVNAIELAGSMQFPADIFDGLPEEIFIRVVRTMRAPKRPELRVACPLKITDLRVDENFLQFKISEEAAGFIKIYSPSEPSLQINGVDVDFEWLKEENLLYIDRKWHDGDAVLLRICKDI